MDYDFGNNWISLLWNTFFHQSSIKKTLLGQRKQWYCKVSGIHFYFLTFAANTRVMYKLNSYMICRMHVHTHKRTRVEAIVRAARVCTARQNMYTLLVFPVLETFRAHMQYFGNPYLFKFPVLAISSATYKLTSMRFQPTVLRYFNENSIRP